MVAKTAGFGGTARCGVFGIEVKYDFLACEVLSPQFISVLIEAEEVRNGMSNGHDGELKL